MRLLFAVLKNQEAIVTMATERSAFRCDEMTAVADNKQLRRSETTNAETMGPDGSAPGDAAVWDRSNDLKTML